MENCEERALRGFEIGARCTRYGKRFVLPTCPEEYRESEGKQWPSYDEIVCGKQSRLLIML